jgi:hypothetical protein
MSAYLAYMRIKKESIWEYEQSLLHIEHEHMISFLCIYFAVAILLFKITSSAQTENMCSVQCHAGTFLMT